ncbi:MULTISPECIES: DUF3177 family protein [unclassified Coleofasciculus]|uniref:DUF3177 family protein n=1 Tax=unclassified Coleofasciculus TaxID=2692782 RepID=UPI00187ECC36|nr:MULTISPECIES: DUF3177 family protein [unclassified Coleofasciculus]MBE9129290.1 DUF3177 family protein [Coleofasciculus sp. LEGE 07081]MBE9151926.1 DUF3177 family protein [Coleofasciculus sp. LEGE 07092]
MQDELFRALVWTDYRLAVLFMVILPLILLIWAFVQKADAIVRLLIIYWRVASLLAITVYIMIATWPIGFASGFFARILIPISLWFWVDLNEDIEDRPTSPLKLSLTSWRWATTIYCLLGALWTIPSLGCAFAPKAIQKFSCSVWLEPPLLFKQYFHPTWTPQFLGFLGMTGLFFYVLYLSYFVLIRLGKQGRSAMEQ